MSAASARRPASVGVEATFTFAALRLAALVVYALLGEHTFAAITGTCGTSLVHDVRAVIHLRIARLAESVRALAGRDRAEVIPAVHAWTALAAFSTAPVLTTCIHVSRTAVGAAAQTGLGTDRHAGEFAGTARAAVPAKTIRSAFTIGAGGRTTGRSVEAAHVVAGAARAARSATTIGTADLSTAIRGTAHALEADLVQSAFAAIDTARALAAPSALASLRTAVADLAELIIVAIAAGSATPVVTAVLAIAGLLAALPFLAAESVPALAATFRPAAAVLATHGIATDRDATLARVAGKILTTLTALTAATVVAALLPLTVRKAANALPARLETRTIAARSAAAVIPTLPPLAERCAALTIEADLVRLTFSTARVGVLKRIGWAVVGFTPGRTTCAKQKNRRQNE